MEIDREMTNVEPSDRVASVAQVPSSQKTPRKRVIGKRAAAAKAAAKLEQDKETQPGSDALSIPKPSRPARALNQVPASITENPEILEAIAMLPTNYSFEILKTIHRIRTSGAKNVALQFPEGLLIFAPMISDILTHFCPGTDTLIMGDVTYGACCVDDYTARALGCDLLIHYGHSCLVPMTETGGIKTLYVFVIIGIDVEHLVKSIERSFQPGKKIALVGTIQFNTTLHAIVPRLRALGYEAILPRSAPLSAGEILGCTAPTLRSTSSGSASTQQNQTQSKSAAGEAGASTADMILYVGDGRFHLESILIASPALRMHTYRYDPYARKLTHETYDHEDMHSLRRSAVQAARNTLRPKWKRKPRKVHPTSTTGAEDSIRSSDLDVSSQSNPGHESSAPGIPVESIGEPPQPIPRTWGLILGTLGRQGNPHTLSLITNHLDAQSHPHITMMLSEITPQKLALMSRDVGVWVQVACPRLSIDWGYAFERPLLSPYEACIALGVKESADWAGGDNTLNDTVNPDRGPAREDIARGPDLPRGAKKSQQQVGVYRMDYYEKSGLGRTRAEDVGA